jgi:hypothetical protein
MTTPRRFLSTAGRRGTDTPASLRFQPAGSADPQFGRVPKFFVSDRRTNKAQEPSKESINDSAEPLGNGDNDNIQDPSSEESSKLPHPNSHVQNPGLDDEMLFDTFVERPSMSHVATSPVRKRPRTGDLRSGTVAHSTELPLILSPASKATATSNRYRLPTTNTVQSNFAPSIPSFLTPTPTTENVEATISAIFSPHRKSQKFLPSSLASSMRNHIIEAMSVHTQPSFGPKNDAKVQVVRSHRLSGMSLIEGNLQTSGQTNGRTNMLLVGPAATPKPGDVVQIKGITWTIEIQERSWTVLLDWKVES